MLNLFSLERIMGNVNMPMKSTYGATYWIEIVISVLSVTSFEIFAMEIYACL